MTPGSISTARKGSPNAPGRRRTSARDIVVAPGGGISPRTVISIGFGGGGGGGFGAPEAVAIGEGIPGAMGGAGAIGAGAMKEISARIAAAVGAPSRVAGVKRQPDEAAIAASAKGDSPSATRADRTFPSALTVMTSRTRPSPRAPSG